MLKRFKLQFPKKWLKKCQKPASSATFVHLRPNRCRLEHSARQSCGRPIRVPPYGHVTSGGHQLLTTPENRQTTAKLENINNNIRKLLMDIIYFIFLLPIRNILMYKYLRFIDSRK